MGFLLSNYQLTICILFSLIFCFSSSSAHLCHNDESTALLQFKQSLSFNCSASRCNRDPSVPYDTDNWKEGTDCCAWDGVTCDNTTSHVIGLDLYCNCLYGTIHPNSSLFNLVHLQHLDLSCNNFTHSQILPSFGRFTNLTHLDLSESYLSGPIQSSEEVWQGNNFSNSIFHLQKLQVLWLYGNRELTGKLPNIINGTLRHLRHLRSLALSYIDFTGELPNSIGQLEYLEELYLYDCNLFGTIPTSLGNLKKLRMLSLGGNNLNNGQFPSSIGHLKNLEELYLQSCNFFGTIPTSLGNLKKLRILDLQGNNLINGQFPSSIGHLKNLEELYLESCNFFGTIPTSLGNLKKLRMLYLRGNNLINGQFPSSIGHLKNLEELYLSDCNFSGTIPRSLTNLTRLISLDLSYNNFEGPIPQFFPNFSQLQFIDFSNNQLTGPIPSSITGLPNLQYLYLGSNSINGTIPPSLFHLVNLTYLDLSSNNLSDTVELDTFAKIEYLNYLDLSNSGLSLTSTNSTPSSFRNIRTLRLSSCNICKIPEFLKTRTKLLEVLDLSNNHLNEEPNPLCNLHSLRYLNLSNNQFAGLIPTCLGNFNGNLTSLNLQRNNFHGTIPQTFGNASMLQELDISHNGLQGILPRSLANCTNLEILNLGHNFIEDAFPFWLENLPQLKVVVLRYNKFHGPIEQPRKRLAFTNLHIIDMSHNEFTGTLPSKYFESMHSMMMDDEDKSSLNYMGNDYGYYSVTIMNKGLEMEFVRIITILKAIDFSHNKFDGNIPISIGRLKALCVLNFSSNGLTGLIPVSLGDLTELESLDLSQNKLSGEIPQQLTSLTFLEVFDVSQNNLTGIIPRGQQFETFSNTSYEGNLGLCGFPLSKNCGNVQIAESPTLPSAFSHNFKFKFDGFGWEAVLMGYGCGVLLGLLIGSYIIRRKEEWLVRIFGVKMRQNGKRSKKVRKKIAHTKSIINCS
ncbi:receptor-like protein 12 [Camellia sinensis]|uniref:Uncharacterized protein n=1 Tax=Camellia sinensis var. sinensis TaxID=542762 RepID=A0A4S4EWK2_CAMSN|nr:receptor-like protein 12 [Camellia sinensis]THG21381.1 hypothetical protein TEA_016319 [Camellia sinensis var. sinensis]